MISIKVPPLGESIVEATISRWLKQEGEAVAAGETLVELETDKVTVEVPATKAGVLVRRVHKDGDVVGLGEVLGELDDTATAAATTGTSAGSSEASAAVPSAQPDAARAAPRAPAAPEPARAAADVRASPAARRLAEERGVDLEAVPGTGRGGVVSKPDVVEYVDRDNGSVRASVEAPAAAEPARPQQPERPARAPEARPAQAAASGAAPAAPAAPLPKAPLPATPAAARQAPVTGPRETREKMSTRRKRIAEHLVEAQHATAHLTTFNEIDMSAVENLRGRIKERVEKEHGVRLSFMPFFVRAACLALKQFPMVNAKVDGDHVVYHHYVNMGIAVASDAGLVVPNIMDADRKGLVQIAQDIVDIAKRARDGKLTMEDLTGGTFTITNGGVFGSMLSTPIINFPQVGILGLHRIQDRPMVVEGKIEIRPMMYVALSYDHRIIDGQQAVLFLVRVKELMEDPALMVVD